MEGRHFDCCIWVTISQEVKIVTVLKKMLKKLQKDVREDEDDEYFIREVHASLRKKKYLIILDDVWLCEHWTSLEVAFPEEHNGSRVLITTRFKDVAKKSDAANKSYELRTLRKDESEQLLLKKAFPNQPANKCPDNLLPLINQFCEKCDGWPIALVMLGGMLSTKDTMYWDGLLSEVWKNKECLDIISTSYKDLPFDLKLCFMYLAVFPEDYQIKASNLIQLWISEGLIIQGDQSTQTMEDIAENYLEELSQRCMIQVSKRSWSGRINYCNIHDFLRELAIRKAKEDSFLLLCSESNADSISRTSTSTRRIAFYKYGDINLPIESIGRSLRSLSIFGEYYVRPNHNLTMVRVLNIDVGRNNFGRLQNYKWLEFLIALRYFQCNDFLIREVPISFWNNKMLRYFNCFGIDNSWKTFFLMGPPSSANLENLLTLKGVVARGEWGVKLPHFPRIRKLGIVVLCGDIDWEALVNSMSKLEHLCSLRVQAYGLLKSSDELQYDLMLVPDFRNYTQLHSLYLEFEWADNVYDALYLLLLNLVNLLPPNLVKLTLSWSALQQDPMPELEKLPNLRVLRLLERSYIGERLVCSKGGFKCLQQLKLEGLHYLVELKIEEGGMRNLNQLLISDCPELNVVPDFQYLTNLRELNLQDMPNDFWVSLKGVDQHKIQHIPSKLFNWKINWYTSFSENPTQ